jgi:hypothetical protein
MATPFFCPHPSTVIDLENPMHYLLTRLRAGRRRRRDIAFCEECAGVCSPEWRRESRLAAYHKAALDALLLRS